MSKGKRRYRRNNLYRKNPHCHWCGILTMLPENFRHGKRRIPPDNMATIDHLYSRHHPLRNTPQLHPHEERTVLSCIKCNRERGKIENDEIQRNNLIILKK